MRNLLVIALVLAATMWSAAAPRHNLDPGSRAALAAGSVSRHRMANAVENTDPQYVPIIADVSGPEGFDHLDSLGAVIYHRRDNLVLCSVPRENLDGIDRSPFIDGASVARAVEPSLDRGRSGSGLADAGLFNDSPSGYDGRGVIVGLCDVGFDPGHIAFAGRICMISTYDEYRARRSVYAPGSRLHHDGTVPASDTPDECHATHVAGILAGGFSGNPYRGAAPGASIAVSLSQCSDVGLLCGIEDIVAYAAEAGKPAVINLSMSSYTGPHDGSDLVNRYLDILGKEAVIVFAAGNTGHRNNTLAHTFDADTEPVGANLESYTSWAGFDVNGMVDIWSADSRNLDFQLLIWDVLLKKEVFTTEWISTSAEGSFSFHNACPELWDSLFPESYMEACWHTDSRNNRFNLALAYSVNPVEELPGGNHWARYVTGWRVRGPEGASFHAFSDGILSYLRNYGAKGMKNGNSDLSINNMSCNRHTITVGSWNSRNSVPVAGAADRHFPFTENTATDFSSYGTLPDGRTLPHVCAPGNYVVSATSAPWLAAHPGAAVSHTDFVNGTSYSWHAECGTSMASPMAAGIIALWLQADPGLTVTDILRIISLTSRFPEGADPADPRWGAGAINAAAGLRMVMDSAGVPSVGIPFVVSVNGRRITATIGGQPSAVNVTDLSGRPVDASRPLAPGVYLVSAPAYPSVPARRILIR